MARDPLTGGVTLINRDPLGALRVVEMPHGISSAPAAVQDIAGNDVTITLPTNGYTKAITAGAARTGAILPVGSFDGQMLVLINRSAAANTVTMAAAATSNVADGVSTIIRGLQGTEFMWDATAARWFKKGSGA